MLYVNNMCMHLLILQLRIFSISIRLSSIDILSGSMLKMKTNLEIMLGVKDFDLARRENPPTVPNDDSVKRRKSENYYKLQTFYGHAEIHIGC